jgi:ketosteroid isomerase-like protein
MSEGLSQQREERFIEGVGAFMRRDFAALEALWRPDVLMHLPGSSWLAGTYRGPEDVGRCILGLRQVLDTSERQLSFLHERDHMIVSHRLTLHGPSHEVEMSFAIAVSYHPDGRMASVSVEPEDLGLFDHVLGSALTTFGSTRTA